MTAPRLSIVMAAYNSAGNLREALDSILAQSFADFEFIILDDGSTDATPAMLAACPDPRVRLVRGGGNAGLTARLNEGLALARADIVARMDADDVAHPDRLARQWQALAEDPSLIAVFSHAQIIDRKGRVTGHSRPDFGATTPLAYLRDFGNVLIHSTAMMRKAPIAALGGYDPALRTRQDYDLWMKCLETGHRVAILPESLLQLRVHEGSISSSGRHNWRLNCVVAARSVLRQAGVSPLPGIEAMIERAEGEPAVKRYVAAIEAKRRLRMAQRWRRPVVAAGLLLSGGPLRLLDAARPTTQVAPREALVAVYQDAG